MMDGWTLEELVRRVADALAVDEVRAPNGRIREVPDARAIRWYTTIGLLDRPAGFRGRTALYGPRHLLQAVAVKRRQAHGLALAQIQAELAGATDATLRRVARVPVTLLEGPPAQPVGRPEVAPAAQPAGVPSVGPAAQPVGVPSVGPATRPVGVPSVRPATQPRDVSEIGPAAGSAPPEPARAVARRGRSPFWATPPPVRAAAELRYRVALAGGVTLDLPSSPSPRDLADITAVTEPLIRLLAERGLLTPEEPSE
jgi:DNA-binding transcriptional MerR regulator